MKSEERVYDIGRVMQCRVMKYQCLNLTGLEVLFHLMNDKQLVHPDVHPVKDHLLTAVDIDHRMLVAIGNDRIPDSDTQKKQELS